MANRKRRVTALSTDRFQDARQFLAERIKQGKATLRHRVGWVASNLADDTGFAVRRTFHCHPSEFAQLDIPEHIRYTVGQELRCEACDKMVAFLVFAPGATDDGRFEDYARLMYPHYARHNMPTYIIGPELGDGPMAYRLFPRPCKNSIQGELQVRIHSHS